LTGSPLTHSYVHPLVRAGAVEQRSYQVSIAGAATKGNSLVVLPTALGKTVISAFVAADVLLSYRDARVLVMAPTRPLVLQHRGSFLRMLKLREEDAVMLTGNTAPEIRGAMWKGPSRVIFATPEVVRNDLSDGRFTLGDFGLLIFDECHRAVKEYAYTDVGNFYLQQAKSPLILAMTASPGSRPERIGEVCKNLSIEQVFFRTEEDADVRPYIQSIRVDWRRINLPERYAPLNRSMRAMLMGRLRWLSEKGLLRGDLRYVGRRELVELGELLRYRLEEGIEEERDRWMRAIMQQSMALTVFHMIELLMSQGPQTLSSFIEKMEEEKGEKRSYGILLAEMKSMGMMRELEGLRDVPHPKVTHLLRIVSEHLRESGQSRILVFSQYRDTVNYLVEMLGGVEGVTATRFVGQASAFSGRGMSQEEQARILNEFRVGDINVLVATNIAEEGLDIPEVDLVIFYEPIPSEIRYIQRRGRTGRRAPGNVIVLVANDTLDTAYLRSSMKRLENMRAMMAKLSRSLAMKPLRPRPAPNPLTEGEVLALEGVAPPPISVESRAPAMGDGRDVEKEAASAITKGLDKAYKALYLKLLEYGGRAGAKALLSDLEIEGYADVVSEAAIKRLLKDGKVVAREPGQLEIAKTGVGGDHEVSVERILPGHAVVFVDQKWRARLTPEDYRGPRSVLRKGVSFRAVGQLYRLNGVLCIRIDHVTGMVKDRREGGDRV